MKTGLKVSVVIVSLLSLTQLSIAELDIKEPINSVESKKPKKLQVNEGATKIGESNSTKPKMRALRIEHPEDEAKDNANVNVGKLDFFVK